MTRRYPTNYYPESEGMLDEGQEEFLLVFSVAMQIYNITQANEQDRLLSNIAYSIEKLDCRLDEIESKLKKIQRYNERSVYNG